MVRSIEQQRKAFISSVVGDYPYDLEELFFGSDFIAIFNAVWEDLIIQHSKIKNIYFSHDGQGIINFGYLDHFLIFCYRLANKLSSIPGREELADAIYYSSRVRTSTDLYHRAVIGDYFLPSHPLGAIIDSKATYGKGFRVYNGVHIGPYGIDGKPPSEWIHPIIGDGVILYANSRVYGKTTIGRNVTVTPGTIIINEEIPDDCIVFGSSPNLKVMTNKEDNLLIFS